MTDSELGSATRAAGEPLGEGSADPDLEHAMAVLRAATISPDADRRARVLEASQGTGSILYLWPLAAGVAACFIIGIGVLIFVAIGGGTHRPQVSPIAKSNAPTNEESVDPEPNEGQGQLDKPARPDWLTAMVKEVTSTKTTLGTQYGSKDPKPPIGGGSGGKVGAPPSASGGGSGDATGGNSSGDEDLTPAEQLEKVADTEQLTVFRAGKLPKALKLSSAYRVEDEVAGLPVVRVEYENYFKLVLVLFQVPESEKARAFLTADDLTENAYSTVINGTRVLLVSNKLTRDELVEIASTLSPYGQDE